MTNLEFAELCKAQQGSGYVWGGLGYPLDNSRMNQLKALYPKVYTPAYIAKCNKWWGMKVYDCVGLIKHFLWGNAGDGKLKYYDAKTDYSANTMFSKCVEKGSINTLPEIVGLALHTDGHCGVYLGGGLAVEARGVDYGVVITDVKTRNWTSWGKLPNIEYIDKPSSKIHLSELADILRQQGITEIII